MIDDNKNEIDISKNVSKTLSVVTGMTLAKTCSDFGFLL
jgi:hypothetical protein